MVTTRDKIVVDDLEIRPLERVVLVKGHEVPLTSAEFDIVMLLAEHPGWVYSADQLSGDEVEGVVSPESVSVLVSRLRHRLAEAGLPDVVETVRGFGYRFRASLPSDEHPMTDKPTCDLRDAAWRLQETLIEVEHAGSADQKTAVAEMVDATRRAIRDKLAE